MHRWVILCCKELLRTSSLILELFNHRNPGFRNLNTIISLVVCLTVSVFGFIILACWKSILWWVDKKRCVRAENVATFLTTSLCSSTGTETLLFVFVLLQISHRISFIPCFFKRTESLPDSMTFSIFLWVLKMFFILNFHDLYSRVCS